MVHRAKLYPNVYRLYNAMFPMGVADPDYTPPDWGNTWHGYLDSITPEQAKADLQAAEVLAANLTAEQQAWISTMGDPGDPTPPARPDLLPLLTVLSRLLGITHGV